MLLTEPGHYWSIVPLWMLPQYWGLASPDSCPTKIWVASVCTAVSKSHASFLVVLLILFVPSICNTLPFLILKSYSTFEDLPKCHHCHELFPQSPHLNSLLFFYVPIVLCLYIFVAPMSPSLGIILANRIYRTTSLARLWALQMAETLPYSSSYTCLSASGAKNKVLIIKTERGGREKRIPGALGSDKNHRLQAHSRAVKVCPKWFCQEAIPSPRDMPTVH